MRSKFKTAGVISGLFVCVALLIWIKGKNEIVVENLNGDVASYGKWEFLMKRVLVMLAVAGSVTAITASDAAAWGCFARGTTGATGWSWAYDTRGAAVRRALSECAVRTPRGEMCRITNCSPYANTSGYWGR